MARSLLVSVRGRRPLASVKRSRAAFIAASHRRTSALTARRRLATSRRCACGRFPRDDDAAVLANPSRCLTTEGRRTPTASASSSHFPVAGRAPSRSTMLRRPGPARAGGSGQAAGLSRPIASPRESCLPLPRCVRAVTTTTAGSRRRSPRRSRAGARARRPRAGSPCPSACRPSSTSRASAPPR